MKTSQDQGTWSIRPEASGTGDAIELDYQKCVATVRPDSSLRPAEAVKEVACRVLLNAGRLPIHGALVTRDGGLSGTLLLGDSGHGKSSLVWLALSAKWRCVSDDLVAVSRSPAGDLVGATVRRRLRFPADLVDHATRLRGMKMVSDKGLKKIRIDPDAVQANSFLLESRIDRLVFLEHGQARAIDALSRSDAMERLLTFCVPAIHTVDSRAQLQLLAGLAGAAPAKVARLTRACLEDSGVLDELAA